MESAEKGISSYPVYAYNDQGCSRTHADIIREISLQIFFNERRLATIACTGIYLDELVVGYLKSEGLIGRASDITEIHIDSQAGIIHILSSAPTPSEKADDPFRGHIASSGARSRLSGDLPAPPMPIIQAALHISPEQVLHLLDRFVDLCHLHRATRGTHGAALTDGKRILVIREDIGRHNAIDMLAGHVLLNQWNCSDKAVLRTGRISTEIVYKIWDLGIPIVVSLSVPTARAIEVAREAGITLIGAIRNRSMKVYTHERRIGL